MKISLSWLNDYIDVSDYQEKPELLSEQLTQAGLEVEGIENKSKEYDNVVVGHLLEVGQHPDADRLTLCQVSTGQGVVHQIVCGAKNHKSGDHVAVALPGAILPGDFKIKKSKIRGVESNGMLCSSKELGLGEDSDGILILPETANVGQPFAEFWGLDDIIFELKVTPNRSDCLSHFGLAREISTLTGRELKHPLKSFKKSELSTKENVQLNVLDENLCPRYAGRLIKSIKVKESPDWLKKRLQASGMNSINNIVDITNYVMLELGQPMHAFDVKNLEGSRVEVSVSRKSEVFTSLDGSEYKMTGEELTIRDGQKMVALAGVVGGQNSGVNQDTVDIFLESAYFASSTVRKTSRKFGIQTESSYRFSRGTDPNAVLVALNRATELVQELAGGEVASDYHDFYPNPIEREPIIVRKKYLEDRLGFAASKDNLKKWFERLSCQVELKDETSFTVRPPTFRSDLLIEEDMVEEYARLEGYENIPESLPPNTSPSHFDRNYLLQKRISQILRSLGYQQAVNFSFTSETFQKEFLGNLELLEPFGFQPINQVVKLKNPISEELGVMRSSIVPGLVKNISYNSRHGSNFGRLFENGAVFESRDGFKERHYLGLAHWGKARGLWRDKKENMPLVFELKATVEAFLKNLGGKKWVWDQSHPAPQFLHPGQTVGLFFEGKNVGYIGTLHPRWLEALKIKEEVALGEFNLDLLLQGQPRSLKFKAISKLPSVERDIAFVVPKNLTAQSIEKEVSKVAGELLKNIQVFDVFEGGDLSEDEKSLAFRLVLQAVDRTLEEKELSDLQAKIIKAVSEKFNIQVR